MTADLTPRQTVALAVFSTTRYEPWGVADLAALDRTATAALTALADHPRLVDVLRGHRLTNRSAGGILAVCACDVAVDDHAVHLADVLRAWLRGVFEMPREAADAPK